MRNVDVAIIGAGSAGSSARREVSQLTDNYVVIDDGPLGTTCARVGCMPSKVFIQAANDFSRKKKLLEQGIEGGENLTLNSKQTMKHVRSLRDRFVRGVISGFDNWTGEKLIAKRASFIDNNTLQVGDEKIQAKSIIIANGSTPNLPKPFEPFKHFCVNTDQFFELEELPENVAVVGIGVIGMELGQALHNLGVNTLLVGRRKVIAGVSDPDVNSYVVNHFEKELNICFNCDSKYEEVNGQLKIKTERGDFFADKVLLVAGRSTNIPSLKLENTTLELNERQMPKFSRKTFLLEGADNIFIAGDITGEKALLHEASDEGRIAGYNSVRIGEITKFQTRTPIGVTFCEPNIAFVGKNYSQLTNEKIDFVSGQVSFEGQGRSIVKLKEIGMLKVYGEKSTGKILGAELFAPDGEHLAHLLAWIIQMNVTVVEALGVPFYHPVVEEGLRTALRDLRDKCDVEVPPLEIPII